MILYSSITAPQSFELSNRPQLLFPRSGTKRWHMGLQLLLPLANTEDIGACLDDSPVASGLGPDLQWGNLLPSVQELNGASLFFRATTCRSGRQMAV